MTGSFQQLNDASLIYVKIEIERERKKEKEETEKYPAHNDIYLRSRKLAG